MLGLVQSPDILSVSDEGVHPACMSMQCSKKKKAKERHCGGVVRGRRGGGVRGDEKRGNETPLALTLRLYREEQTQRGGGGVQ
jgi:hypothetical protein